jgi:uncharacterized phage protein (TIGR01671 family)
MNREIKFRARDTKNNKWLDSVPSMEYLLDDGDHSISHHDIDDESSIYIYPKNLLGDTFDSRIVWQQYTGLKDSKGVEIYEGDICNAGMVTGPIEFIIGGFSLASNPLIEFLPKDACVFSPDYDPSWIDVEVVGNVCENPDYFKNNE